jgi:uncharacterized membrane protein
MSGIKNKMTNLSFTTTCPEKPPAICVFVVEIETAHERLTLQFLLILFLIYLPFHLPETRKKARFNVVASEKNLAFTEAAAFRTQQLRFWWRKLIKARIKMLDDTSTNAE